MQTDPYGLERFVVAQNEGGTYQRALQELRDGRKTTHWMWFVFPQVAGLGMSPTSVRYAIGSLAEARAYLQHGVLGPRLVACAQVVAGTRGRSADQIFGPVDAQKLRSCMTLFLRADPQQLVYTDVLERYFGGIGDAATDRLLAS